MSVLHINNITNKEGTGGPTIAGITTVDSTGFMKVPVGDTFRRSVLENVVTNGLVLYLDAGNTVSYPGSGTTWTDLSGNGNNGTLENGVGYNSGNGGSLVFDGVDDYVLISSGISYSEYTFMFFCRWISSVGVSERIFGSDAFGTYTIFNPSNVGFHYNPLGGSPPSVTLSSGVNIGFGTWCQVAVTVSTSNTLVKIYINGVLRNSSSILPSQNLVGNLFIGSQNTLYKSNCNVSNFNLYNRALTAQEIQQNYNALVGRYS